MAKIVSTTGTTGTPKRIELSKEVLQARADLTTIAKGKNIADCQVIHVGMSEKSSAFTRFKEWGEQTGKKIIGIIPLNEMVDIWKILIKKLADPTLKKRGQNFKALKSARGDRATV